MISISLSSPLLLPGTLGIGEPGPAGFAALWPPDLCLKDPLPHVHLASSLSTFQSLLKCYSFFRGSVATCCNTQPGPCATLPSTALHMLLTVES